MANIEQIIQLNPEDSYKNISLDIEQIKITGKNRYGVADLEDLASSILMDGLQEPLIIGKVSGEYLLCGGHRRVAAMRLLASEGNRDILKNIPCRYREMTMLQFRLSLLIGNTFNRKLTNYDLMMQAAEWKEVLTEARKEKLIVLEKGERIRDYVAKVLGESSTKIAQLEAINNNAIPEVKEQFEQGNMGITSAYEASQLEEEEQKEAAVKASEAPKKKKRKTKEDEVREQNVSDTDTSEEEKEKARKLHAVKMIEKYYLYLSQEEVELLERILEDCKRRKREYSIEED